MVFSRIKNSSCPSLSSCVFKKLDQVTNSISNKTLGERLFVNRMIELAPFKPVPFTGWGNWECDPVNNRSWQWRLNWLSFLSYLMAYHRTVRDDAVLEMAKSSIESWLQTYLSTDNRNQFEFIWHDHATALRAEQLVLFAFYCRTHTPTWFKSQGVFFEYLEHALHVHGNLLAQDDFYSKHTNHGLEQARVLLLLGTIFEGDAAYLWQSVAVKRITSELNFSFTSEGVHVENSPAYHIFVFKLFLSIINDFPSEILGGLEERFGLISNNSLEFITHILRPDGLLPPIGDTEQLPTSDAYNFLNDSISYQNFVYSLSQGKRGLMPSSTNRIYKKSGYAIFRNKWGSSLDFKNSAQVIVKMGSLSKYHYQQDEGHISLFAGGEDWLIDSGLYNYVQNDPVRKYMRSRSAHNVPLVSHSHYDNDFKHRQGAWLVTDYDDTSPRPFVEIKL